MTKRLIVTISLILYALSVTFAQTTVALSPTSAFTLDNSASLHLVDVATYGNQLYFLLTAGGAGQGEVVITSADGLMVSTITLSNFITVRALRINTSGNLVLLGSTAKGQQIVTLDRLGNIISNIDTDGTLNSIVSCNGFLLGMAYESVTVFPSTTVISLTGLVSSPYLAGCLPNNQFALVEEASARLAVLDLDGTLRSNKEIVAPEIQGVERPQIEGVGVAIVYTMDTDSSGRIYLGISGSKRQEGVPVLQMRSDGTVQQRIKCTLPTFGQDPTDHRSYMYPTLLRVAGTTLFWISVGEKKVARYSLN